MRPAKKAKSEIKVAYLGSKGSYCDLLTTRHFEAKGVDVTTIDSPTCKEATRKVESGEVDYCLLPFENSSSGILNDVFDIILSGSLRLVGECTNIEEHCLCALPGTTLSDVRNVLSHPHILSQCSKFLVQLGSDCPAEITQTLYRDSASACKKISGESLKTSAAIASKESAQLHKLVVLKGGIGNDKNNETRYLVLAKKDPTHDLKNLAEDFLHSSKKLKSSIAVSLPNETNALFRLMSLFALRELNIIKLESRPACSAPESESDTGVRHWDLLFFIEFEPAYSPAINKSLMENVSEFSKWVRELGTYEQTVKLSQVNFELNDITTVLGY